MQGHPHDSESKVIYPKKRSKKKRRKGLPPGKAALQAQAIENY